MVCFVWNMPSALFQTFVRMCALCEHERRIDRRRTYTHLGVLALLLFVLFPLNLKQLKKRLECIKRRTLAAHAFSGYVTNYVYLPSLCDGKRKLQFAYLYIEIFNFYRFIVVRSVDKFLLYFVDVLFLILSFHFISNWAQCTGRRFDSFQFHHNEFLNGVCERERENGRRNSFSVE